MRDALSAAVNRLAEAWVECVELHEPQLASVEGRIESAAELVGSAIGDLETLETIRWS
jgi:hypothetical protein